MTRRHAGAAAPGPAAPPPSDSSLRRAIHAAAEASACLHRVADSLAQVRRRAALAGAGVAAEDLAGVVNDLVAAELSLAEHQLRQLRAMLGVDGPLHDLSVFSPGLTWVLPEPPGQPDSLLEHARQLEQSTRALTSILDDLIAVLRARLCAQGADTPGHLPARLPQA